MPDMLKTRDMAAKLGLHPQTFLRWVKRFNLPCIRPNSRTTLFDPIAVRAALEANQKAGA